MSFNKNFANMKIITHCYVESVLNPYFVKYKCSNYILGSSQFHKLIWQSMKLNHKFHHPVSADTLWSKFDKNYFCNKDIPVKSPDESLIDFFGSGILKQALNQYKTNILNGIWKVFKGSWETITPEMAFKVFQAWKWSCLPVAQQNYGQIEYISSIHWWPLKELN